MKVQAFLDFFIAHNSEIIQWLIAAILLIFCGYIAWFLFRKPGRDEISESSTESTEEIKKALHEVLEATKKVSDGVAVKAGVEGEVATDVLTAPAPVGEASVTNAGVSQTENEAENIKLQQKIESLQKELEATKAASQGSEESKAKVEELEAKLAEYEILEDDIADLSLFKEENEKLKKKLAELGSGLDEAAPTVTETVNEEGESLVEEFQAAVELTSDASSESEDELMAPLIEEPEDADADAGTSIEDDFVAEFQAAVNVKEDSEEEKTAVVATSEDHPITKDDTKDDTSDETDEIETVSADDLMAEFAQSMGGESIEEEPAENSITQLDTNKMLEEMEDLTLNPSDADASSALEESIDTEKMVAEANKLDSES